MSSIIGADTSIPIKEKPRRVKVELKELNTSEIPFSLKQTTKSQTQAHISRRIKSAVASAPRDELKIIHEFSPIPDSFTSRAFKDYLYQKGFYDVEGLENIERLSNRPNSINEMDTISPPLEDLVLSEESDENNLKNEKQAIFNYQISFFGSLPK